MRKVVLVIAAVLVALVPTSVLAEELDILQKEAIETGKYLLVDIGRDRCVSCIRMRENLQAIEEEVRETVTIKMLHMDKVPELCLKYEVILIPFLMILDPQGNQVFKNMGLMKEEGLKTALRKAGAI